MNKIRQAVKQAFFNHLPLSQQSRLRWLRDVWAQREVRGQIRHLLSAHRKVNGETKQVLFWSAPGGMAPIIEVEAIIATALRLRGAEVHFVICDGAPLACIMREVTRSGPIAEWKTACPRCFQDARSVMDRYGISYHTIGKLVQGGDLPRFTELDGHRLILASVTRYLMGHSTGDHKDLIRAYRYAGLVNECAARTIYRRMRPNSIVMSHGTYVDWGIAHKVALETGIPTTVWGAAFRPNHFWFCGETWDLHQDRLEKVSRRLWQGSKDQPLTREEKRRLSAYLDAGHKTDAGINVMGIPDSQPVWCLFTHLVWEGIFNYGPSLFDDDPNRWLIETVRAMVDIENVSWLIKVHPAELQNPGAVSALDVIRGRFPDLPPHIKIIPRDAEINTLHLLHLIDGGITMFGSVGLQLAALGRRVVLAGRPYYGMKGFTNDCTSESEYFKLLRQAAQLAPLSAQQIEWARRYAYIFYIQSQIPLRCLDTSRTGPNWALDPAKLELLLPGYDPFMDMICERILVGGDFILDKDMFGRYVFLL